MSVHLTFKFIPKFSHYPSYLPDASFHHNLKLGTNSTPYLPQTSGEIHVPVALLLNSKQCDSKKTGRNLLELLLAIRYQTK